MSKRVRADGEQSGVLEIIVTRSPGRSAHTGIGQTRIFRSAAPTASQRPSGEKAAEPTDFALTESSFNFVQLSTDMI
ncbi:MAG: hypothetical protein WA996_13110, partial [Candidatus Promineifilaceae bacterium]